VVGSATAGGALAVCHRPEPGVSRRGNRRISKWARARSPGPEEVVLSEEMLNIREAAERLNITPYTLREWIKAGKIEAIKPFGEGPGRREYRLREADIAAMTKGELVKATLPLPRRLEIAEQLLELVRASGSTEEKLLRIEGFALGLMTE
jgi:excisionase family DNA binding protein